jgi:hypothetical protein
MSSTLPAALTKLDGRLTGLNADLAGGFVSRIMSKLLFLAFFTCGLPAMAQSLDEEFFNLAKATVGPRALLGEALSAGILMASPPSHYPGDWRKGAQAFGRNYGNILAIQTSRDSARFLTGALTHEDLGYKPSASKNSFARGLHAVAFTFIDKSDSGHSTIALSNFAGAAAGGFVGNAYLPPGYNDMSHAASRSAIAFGLFAAKNVVSEFSPEIRTFVKKLHLPRVPIPVWWVPDK